MPLHGGRGAGVGHAGYKIPAVGSISNGHVHALVSQDTGDNQVTDLKILEQVINISRVEDAR